MKNIITGLLTFFISLSGYSQEVFMYGEGGKKVYFQKVDSIIQVKFKENVNYSAKLEITRMISRDKAVSYTTDRNRLFIPIDKNKKPDYNGLKMNKSIIYANQSLISNDGIIHIPTHKVLVGIKSSYNIEEILNMLNIEFKSYKRLGHNKNSYLIELNSGESLKIANTLYESGHFDYAQPSFTRLIKVMNELYPDQWGLNNTGQHGGTAGIDINATEAWNITSGCSNITVAVIDQGVDLDHPDLENNLLTGYDATDGGLGGTNGDCWGNDAHGTACAGIVAAEDNTIGTIGVAPGCNIIPVRVSYTDINGIQEWDDDWIINAINHAWETAGADILSCSWGGGTGVAAVNAEIDAALSLGRNNLGCIVVFATGNYNTSVSWPANSNPDIIAVGAMSPCGERKNPNSCDDESWYRGYPYYDYLGGSNYGSQIDLIAPGVLIPTTDIQGNAGYNDSNGIDGNYHATFNGTSSACPHVAGVAALMLSVNPGLTQDQVSNIIESTCTKVGNYNYSTVTGRDNGAWDDEVGYGCVNAYRAVLKASGGAISGPDLVCTSNTTFSLTGETSGLTFDWGCDTDALTQVGDNSGSSYVVKANSSSTIGESWVKVKIISASGDTITRQANLWVGVPDHSRFVAGATEYALPQQEIHEICNEGQTLIEVAYDEDGTGTNVSSWSK